jgi:hypothetical protein
MRYFGQNYHVVSMNFWGTGRSERIGFFPDNWWEQGAHDASALAEHLGYQECMVMAEQVEFWKWAQGNDWQKVVEADSDFLLRFEKQEGFRRKIASYHPSRS